MNSKSAIDRMHSMTRSGEQTHLINRAPTLSQNEPSISQLSHLHYTGNLTVDFDAPRASETIINSYEQVQEALKRTMSTESDHYKTNSKFEELIAKLNKIKSAQKKQIVIIGQRKIVKYLMRKIRELEVEHPAMRHLTRRTAMDMPFLSMVDTPSGHDGIIQRSRAESRLILHTMQVENIPPMATEDQVFEFFKEFGKVLDVSLKCEVQRGYNNISNANSPNNKEHKFTKSEIALEKSLEENHLDINPGVNSNTSNASNNSNNSSGKLETNNNNMTWTKAAAGMLSPTLSGGSNGTPHHPAMVATIAFEIKLSCERVLEKAESPNGLEFNGYLLVVRQDTMKTIVE